MARAGGVAAGFTGLRAALGGAEGRAARSLLWASAGPGYGPLQSDPEGVLDLPEGFSYHIFSRTGEKMDDGLLVPGAHDGMAAFPGPDGVTLLVRNHEITPKDNYPGPFGARNELFDQVDPARVYDRGHDKTPGRGGTTTVIYDTRSREQGRLVGHYLSLAGTERNCAGGPTPRGSWITCEETVEKKDDQREQDHGWCFEVPARAEPGLADPKPILGMGRFNHEACATNPDTGAVYLSEDRGDGLFYRFLPQDPDDLHAGGRLQALEVTGRPSLDTRNWKGATVPPRLRMAVRWVDLTDTDAPNDDLRARGFDLGAARFARGEGMWYGRNSVFLCCTNGGEAMAGQIWRYVPAPGNAEGTPAEKDSPGHIELFLESSGPGVMENPDNLTVAPWGDLVICEDGSGEQFLVGVTPAGQPYRLARNAMNGSEFAGSTFSPDGSTLFVNMQRPGFTIAIKGPWQA
jgi:secreted PhoX family phosphatase